MLPVSVRGVYQYTLSFEWTSSFLGHASPEAHHFSLSAQLCAKE